MKSLGIIAEYNPFHEGHKYHIEESRRITGADVVVVVMSGDFVQRGGPAANDKWTRARAAIEMGANLVVELPTVYATSSAEYFAKGGVDVLKGFGTIDYISFGSECGDIKLLTSVAEALETNHEIIHERIQELVKEGNSYPKARQIAAKGLLSAEQIYLLQEPNNILAIEYIKQLQAGVKTLTPITVKREGEGHHLSSSKIRESLMTDKSSGYGQALQRYFDFARAKVLLVEAGELENAFSSGDGLGNRLKSEVRYAKNIEELISMVKSKGYTYTRVSRLVAQALIGVSVDGVLDAKPYIRVLALDGLGGSFLKEVKNRECASIPIITNINKDVRSRDEIYNTLALDIKAADMFNLIWGRDLYVNSDYVMKPYINMVK